MPGPSSRPAPGGPRRRRGRRSGLPTVEETSAGGLVLDRSGPTLKAVIIARHDRRGRLIWSLPKGHLEGDESPEQAALREVTEETGIEAAILAPLGVIDFWFLTEDKRIHKTVHHFLMEAVGGELSDADLEVTAVEWVPLEVLPSRLAYSDERRLLNQVPARLAELG